MLILTIYKLYLVFTGGKYLLVDNDSKVENKMKLHFMAHEHSLVKAEMFRGSYFILTLKPLVLLFLYLSNSVIHE